MAFWTGLVAAAGIYALLIVTILTDYHLWPLGERSWPYYYHWSLVAAFNVALVTVTYSDWNSWVLPRPESLVVGIGISVLGGILFVWGAGTMSFDETMGLSDELHTGGPYAYSRNPQYVGMIVGLVGWFLLGNSLTVALLIVAHIGWVVLLPFAEEPHLAAEFGDMYAEYRKGTPRFIGRQTIRRLFQ